MDEIGQAANFQIEKSTTPHARSGGALRMKRIQYHRYGGPEELHLEEAALVGPGHGQIRVQVLAAASNPMDWKIRRGELKMMTGRKFPRGLGHDFSGVVEAVGSGVTRFEVGDEVFGATGLKESGTFAEEVVADENNVFHKPQSLSFEQAAALTIVSVTAWTGLIEKARLRSGQSVFITGCLGGVGRIAAQIARMRSADIHGSCSASRQNEARSLGFQEVVDYRTFRAEDYRGRFDVVFDTHGSLSPGQCGTMLKHDGTALHPVPTPLKMIVSMLSSRHKTIFAKITPQILAGIAEVVELGKIAPYIGQTVPLSEAITAITELERTGLPSGKLVVTFREGRP